MRKMVIPMNDELFKRVVRVDEHGFQWFHYEPIEKVTVCQSDIIDDERGIWRVMLSCGHEDLSCVSVPNFCPICGAEVETW